VRAKILRLRLRFEAEAEAGGRVDGVKGGAQDEELIC
jgi:hypothetical protein